MAGPTQRKPHGVENEWVDMNSPSLGRSLFSSEALSIQFGLNLPGFSNTTPYASETTSPPTLYGSGR
jgi:hypothetical protein